MCKLRFLVLTRLVLSSLATFFNILLSTRSNVLPASIPKATVSRLAKLGIHQRFDLVLHLPLRYEDETVLRRIADLTPGETAQVEGEITHSEVAYRPRRSLICQLQDDSDILYLRFLNFYPSQQKQLAIGKKIRALGEACRVGHELGRKWQQNR